MSEGDKSNINRLDHVYKVDDPLAREIMIELNALAGGGEREFDSPEDLVEKLQDETYTVLKKYEKFGVSEVKVIGDIPIKGRNRCPEVTASFVLKKVRHTLVIGGRSHIEIAYAKFVEESVNNPGALAEMARMSPAPQFLLSEITFLRACLCELLLGTDYLYSKRRSPVLQAIELIADMKGRIYGTEEQEAEKEGEQPEAQGEETSSETEGEVDATEV